MENSLDRRDVSEGKMLQKAADRMLFSANHLCRSVQPCCTLLFQAAWQQTQFPAFDNSPSSHTALPWPRDTRDHSCRELVLSPALGWAGKGGRQWGSEVCLEVVSNVSPLLCCYSWLGAVQGVETQVRAFLNHLESCYQWVTRWNNCGRTGTLNFCLSILQMLTFHQKYCILILFCPPSIHYTHTSRIHIYGFFFAKACNPNWALQESLHFMLSSETEKDLWWAGSTTLRSVFISLP